MVDNLIKSPKGVLEESGCSKIEIRSPINLKMEKKETTPSLGEMLESIITDTSPKIKRKIPR